MNDLELMSVSDHEKEPDAQSAIMHNGNGSLIEAPDIITRYYYTPQIDLTSSMEDINDSYESINAFNKCDNKKKRIEDLNKNNDTSESETELLCATNFLETEFFVEENEMLIKSPPRMSHVTYGVPCIKKLNFEDQLIKRRTRICKDQESGKIICDMYGVRTINYNLPEPEQKLNEIGIKSSRLSESDSDTGEMSSQPLKTMRLFESEWCDIEKNLHQPLLSDPSSSPSSRSNTSSSSTSLSTSSASSCSTCCSCDKEA